MALKVSYNGQMHRVNPPEDYNALLDTVTSKYPSLSSKALCFYYLECPDNKVLVQTNNYKDLLSSDQTTKTKPLKIFVEVDQAPKQEVQKIEERSEEVTQVNIDSVMVSNVQEEREEAVKIVKEVVSVEEIVALQKELLVTMDDMVYVTRVFERVKEQVIQKSHVFAAFIVFTGMVPNYLKLELQSKLTNALQIDNYDMIKDKNDLVILAKTANDLQKALEVIQEWCTTTSTTIDKNNSALMEFLPRRARKLELAGSIIDIPVVREHKYKGVWLDQKLMFEKQMGLVRQKSQAIVKKMEGNLEESTFEARVEAWKEFIEPLFESLLPIYAMEEAIGRKHELEALVRATFRKMSRLLSNHSSEEVEKVIGYTMKERAEKNIGFYRQGWEMKH